MKKSRLQELAGLKENERLKDLTKKQLAVDILQELMRAGIVNPGLPQHQEQEALDILVEEMTAFGL